jgi:hypothetical protein
MKTFNVVVALVQTWLMVITYRATVPQVATTGSAPPMTTMPDVVIARWPLVLMGILAIVAWLPEIKRIRRERLPTVRGAVMTGQVITPEAAQVTINGASLRDFRKAYKVAVISGTADPAVDKQNDTRISISDAFTIVAQPLEIRVASSQFVIDSIAAQREAALAQAKAMGVPKGTPVAIQIQLSQWLEVVLLPNGVSPQQVRCLADVTRVNGLVLNNAVLEGVVQTATS